MMVVLESNASEMEEEAVTGNEYYMKQNVTRTVCKQNYLLD